MDLKTKSKEISQNLVQHKNKLYEDRDIVRKEIEDNLQDLKDASSQGDRSENAAFTAATEKAQDLQIQYANIEMQINEIEKLRKEENYKPIGMVVYYTTVLLEVPEKNREFVLKLYPGSVANIDKGILARNCPVGQAIWRKTKGESFYVPDRMTGAPLKYIIKDIY